MSLFLVKLFSLKVTLNQNAVRVDVYFAAGIGSQFCDCIW